MAIYLNGEKKYLEKMIYRERNKKIDIKRGMINKIEIKLFGSIIKDDYLLLEIKKKFGKKFYNYNAGIRYLKYLYFTSYKNN